VFKSATLVGDNSNKGSKVIHPKCFAALGLCPAEAYRLTGAHLNRQLRGAKQPLCFAEQTN